MKVLIADDSFPARTILRTILLRSGAREVVECEDGQVALAKLREAEYAFDLVLVDWAMPYVSGIEVAREMARHPIGRRIPLIMVTGEADPQKVAIAFYAGATNYVVKPFSPETIRRKVAEVTSLKNLEATAAIRTDGGLAGDLGTLGLEEVVQFLQLGKKSGDLVVGDLSDTARIRFESGEIVDATFGKLNGEEAFYGIARMRRGKFTLEPPGKGAGAAPRKITRPTVQLLIEAMRRRDEAAEST
jgi:two-component system chemotaxis response regulator CheY